MAALRQTVDERSNSLTKLTNSVKLEAEKDCGRLDASISSGLRENKEDFRSMIEKLENNMKESRSFWRTLFLTIGPLLVVWTVVSARAAYNWMCKKTEEIESMHMDQVSKLKSKIAPTIKSQVSKEISHESEKLSLEIKQFVLESNEQTATQLRKEWIEKK